MQANFSSFHDADIICFSLSRWHAPISSPAVSMAKELSKTHRVFYIEHPYSYKDYLTERKKYAVERDGSITVVTPPLILPVNFLPESKIYNFFSELNDRALINTLRSVITANNIRKYIFLNFFDPFFLRSIPEDIAPQKYVYQCMDDMSQVAYTRRHGVRLEKELIGSADCTLCTSRELTRLKSAFSPNVYFHPNAADTSLFGRAFLETLPRPADLNFPGKTIIGFTGSIEYRTDFALLRAVASAYPDKVLFLIGPVYGTEHVKAGLDRLPNVIFAGSRNLSKLPAYLQHMDCMIIPYKVNTLTRSIYPLKINEYLAAGKPVVSTNFSEDIFSFHECAYITDSAAAFVEAVATAIREDNLQKKQQRINAAALNSWSERVKQFWNIISQQ